MKRSAQPEAPRVPHITGADSLLLRALLCAPQDATRAWQQLTDTLAEPAWFAVLAPYKRTWPLIQRAVRGNGWSVPPRLRTALKAAYVSEKVRHDYLWRRLEQCAAQLAAAGIPSVVRGGAALAVTVYPEPALRHTHALELGVADVEGAQETLSPLGFCVVRKETFRPVGALCLQGPNQEKLLLRSSAPESLPWPPPGAALTLQAPLNALAAAWDETVGTRAAPLVWAFDVFFASRLREPGGPASDRLMEAQRALTDALRPACATQ